MEYLAEYNWVNAEENNLGKPGIAENRVLFHAFREQSRFRKHQLVKIVEMQRCGVLCLIEKVSTLSYLNLFTNSK